MPTNHGMNLVLLGRSGVTVSFDSQWLLPQRVLISPRLLALVFPVKNGA